MEEKVMHLMRKGAVTCSEETSIPEVAQIMVVNGIRYCVVINSSHEVVGIISARSILRGYGRNVGQGMAKEIMLSYTITVTPSFPLNKAIAMMSKRKIEHLIVVSERPGSKALLGLLFAEDIVSRMLED